MKLLLRRGQRSGMLGGKIVFQLEVRADLTPEERSNISKYKLGETVLYERNSVVDRGSGLLGLASRAAFRAMNISVSVNDQRPRETRLGSLHCRARRAEHPAQAGGGVDARG